MIALSDVRPRAAAVLEPATDADPQVIGLTDAVQAPCVQISIAQPWLTPTPQAPAYFYRVQVLAIGGRVEASGALDDLEDLAVYVCTRFALDALPWSALEISAPRGLDIGGVSYLVSRFVWQVPCDATKPRAELPLEVIAHAG